ncbi:hypothetical protein ACHAXA_004587 [Cyclostephanos tholiformis]|uniref:Uncharacterized protein n=1 Tax=Cyclostephanos tholiformis TaxID=382380 RepID=A0ABD3R0Z7_9STRA
MENLDGKALTSKARPAEPINCKCEQKERRDIQHELLQMSFEMSKLQGLTEIVHKLSSTEPYLRTARRPDTRQSNSRCRLLHKAYNELRKPLDLPFYIDQVETNQTEVGKVENTPKSIGLKPVLSRNKSMARCRNESSKKVAWMMSQRKKFDDSAIRGGSKTDACIQTVAEVEPQTFQREVGLSQVSACMKTKRSEPIYKVLAVSSPAQSRREKRLLENLLLENDCSRSALGRVITADSENLIK